MARLELKWNLQQGHRYQEILSRQKVREVQQHQVHQDVQQGQSHHGVLSVLPFQLGQKVQEVQHCPKEHLKTECKHNSED